jgi:hypothetical protein
MFMRAAYTASKVCCAIALYSVLVEAQFGLRQDVIRTLDEGQGTGLSDESVNANGLVRARLLIEHHHDQYSAGGHLIDRLVQAGVDKSIPVKESIGFIARSWAELHNKTGLTYWLHAGAQLGQWCNEGLLPGDDDIDFAMHADEFLLFALSITNNENACRFDPSRRCKRLMPNNTQLIIRHGQHADIIAAKFVDIRTGRFADIVVFHNQNVMKGIDGDLWHGWSNSQCASCSNDNNKAHGQGIHLTVGHSIILPTKPCVYEGVVMQCPAQTLVLAKMMYRFPFFNCGRLEHRGA